MNDYPFKYITIHLYERIVPKIRMKYTCIPKRYTVDDFPKYYHIHHQESPSITIL
jgi:hypothetical protein